MAEVGRYIYVISRDLPDGAVGDTEGLDGGSVRIVRHRGLDAVVSDVDLETYGEEGLRRHLEDLGWLERVARRHDEVVQSVARQGPAAPMRLATICLEDDAVRARLEEWHDQLSQALDRVAGRREWSVKVIAPELSPAAGVAGRAEPAESGAAYLQRKRQQMERRAAGHEGAITASDQVYSALSELAVASRRLQPQDPRLAGHQGTMILNAAFLVPDGDEAAFRERLDSLRQELDHVTLEYAGPWPPYSFATLDQP